jgi:hypothetical protein
VVINDNAGNTDTLTPQGSGLYHTHALKGIEGRTYTLTVQAENHTYTAQSTMPARVPFDAIKVEEVIFGGETEFNISPGGGITPNNPPSNISNGALGIFSAHTTETRSVTIP